MLSCGLQENQSRKFKYKDIIGEHAENPSADPAGGTHNTSVKSYDTQNRGVVDRLMAYKH
jgi:hypothetical protein